MLWPKLHKILPFIQCISNILNIYSYPRSNILVVNSDYEFKVPIIQIRGSPTEITSFATQKFDFYLIDIDKTNISQFLQLFHEDLNFYTSKKILCVGQTISSNTLEIIASYYIVNVIFLNIDSGILETFFPFKQTNLHRVDTNLQRIGKCSETSHIDQLDLFPNKLPAKWKNSRITFCHSSLEPMGFANYEEKGIITEIYRIVLENTGATPVRKIVKLDKSNKRLDFMKEILSSKSCDLYVAGTADDSFDITVPFHIDRMYWFVPAPALNYNYNFILGTFSASVWLAWFSTILCLAMFWSLLSYLTKTERSSFLKKVLLSFELVLEQAAKLNILRTSDFILYTIIIFGTFMMGNIYKGRILYVLSGLHYEETIMSHEGIMKHNLQPGLFPIHMKLFRDEQKFFDYVNRNYQACGMDTKCEDKAAFERNAAVLRSHIIMQFRNKNYLGEDGRLKLISLPNPTTLVYFLCFLLPGHPVYPQINRYTYYLLQNGIINKIISKYSVKIPDQTMSFHRSVLTMQHFKWLFEVWMVGLISSCIIFALEITRNMSRFNQNSV
ncbi:hypothetical protein HHI36_000414 [Cryptolaemus montrouzieri]|uniref:Ionotropic receptor n=1 Tax=Cryptolaemus montrouzieri TaxID=559131 RepID=A0ABD2P516_9CUCU